jgi:hypothetical protein
MVGSLVLVTQGVIMTEEMRARVAKILASATRVEKREDAQEGSISIFGDVVFVSGDIHISNTPVQNLDAHEGGRDATGQ